jgi:hypothetical protein
MSAAAVLHLWAPDLPDVLDRLGPAWIRIDHVPFGATVDVEHVLLSTEGLAVVTTVDAVPSSQHPISEARWRARKVGALLGQVTRVPARPVLVVDGTETIGYGMQDGVLVARAEDAVSWLAHPSWSSVTITPEQIGEMVDVLVRHTQRTDAITRNYRIRAV